jgi:hypothetical protein
MTIPFFASQFERSLACYGSRMSTHEPSQAAIASQYTQFLLNEPEAFERSNTYGHFTGSSFVIDPYAARVLLTHHAKYLSWNQLGGHCDGIRDPFFVAWKESYEEGGLKQIVPASMDIFDLDVHVIPEYKGVKEHYHFDVRYLFLADSSEGFVKSEESIDLAWVDLGQVRDYSATDSMLRLEFKAIQYLSLNYGFRPPSYYKPPAGADER